MGQGVGVWDIHVLSSPGVVAQKQVFVGKNSNQAETLQGVSIVSQDMPKVFSKVLQVGVTSYGPFKKI